MDYFLCGFRSEPEPLIPCTGIDCIKLSDAELIALNTIFQLFLADLCYYILYLAG